MKNPVVGLLLERKLVFQLLDGPSAKDVVRLWWESFSSTNSPQSWAKQKLYWHCFSFGHKPALAFDAAVRAYETIDAKGVWLMAVSGSICVVDIQKRDIPFSILRDIQCKQQILDLYVLEKAASWTFVRTHEDASKLGPYFSRREWNATAQR